MISRPAVPLPRHLGNKETRPTVGARYVKQRSGNDAVVCALRLLAMMENVAKCQGEPVTIR